ncbi:MAG: alpha/beta fold hydrolase [Anaerolineae bacterium]|nr:alpha/beta fold hydrolase [Anaerolineae bacterium]
MGCLCLHGFTASPHEVLWLAQHLGQQGYTVYTPRLAGHGTNPRDLARVRWSDWLNSALDAYYVLRQQCDQVYVCGLSMGALVGLLVSLHVPVDGVVVMAAPLKFEGVVQPRVLRVVKYLRPWTDQADRSPFEQYIREQQQQRGEPVLGRVRYGTWSTAALEQGARMSAEVVRRLPEIDVPVLALYSEKDKTVDTGSLQILQAKMNNQKLEFYVFKRSDHILTQDMEYAEVFQRVAAFIAAQIAGK